MTLRLAANDPLVVAAIGRKRRKAPVSVVPDLIQECQMFGLPIPEAEVVFHPVRKWRFDLAWRRERLAVEINGGAFQAGGGRHTRGAGYRVDCEKLAEAAILGWRVIPLLPEHVTSRQAIVWIERCFQAGLR